MRKYQQGDLLQNINSPSDLRKLKKDQLPELSKELREYIIDIVSDKGGHLGASLGVVELTIAIHYVFDTPKDQLVWDVGHQAYGHKILTGRKDNFHTNRTYKGISGFPKRNESEYDTFGTGHSSTSISAALGMAVASKYKGENEKQHIAVIGDGSMTAGMAFEALNHAGIENSNLLVILNDNCMSIDPAVGALKEYLTDISTSRTYNKAKNKIWRILGKISRFGANAQKVAQKVEGAVKSTLLGESNYFESLNFRYFGPIDGHDVKHLSTVLKDLKNIPGPKILHCLTKKGKGYNPAEEGCATKWHAPGLFEKETGKIIPQRNKKNSPIKYQQVFGESIIELAKENDKIIGVSPAMLSGSSLNLIMEQMPERTFDVGIAEQHAVTFSAGMATQGMIPFCNIYSSFMQRAYDQVIHDVALQNLHVIFCLDRGGLVGADGATHHGAYDIAYLRCIPNMVVAAPMNEQELRNMMYTAQLPKKGPFSIRYPRGNGVMKNWQTPFEEIKIGKGQMIKKGSEVAILSLGHAGNFVKDSGDDFNQMGLSIAHYDMRFAKPLDKDLLHTIFQNFNKVITVEDGCIQGGFGSAILEFMADNNHKAEVVRLGIPDKFINHGTQEELRSECGFDKAAILSAIEKLSTSKKVPQTI